MKTVRTTMCGPCPWDVTNVGEFPPERYVALAATAVDMATTLFACHLTREGNDQVCAGAAARTPHSLTLRLLAAEGRFDPEAVQTSGRVLHESYRAMAVANGVPAGHPALRGCRP